MKKITLDFTDCQYPMEIHYVLRDTFKFYEPETYGCNLDALWDCMKYWFYEPVTVEIHGFHKQRKKSEWYAWQMDGILDVFKDVHEKTPCFEYIVIS